MNLTERIANMRRVFEAERATNEIREQALISALRNICAYDHVTQPGAFNHAVSMARDLLAEMGETP